MNFTRTAIPDVIICTPQVFGDERGYFFESFRQDQLEEFLGFGVDFCQDNEAKSAYGVLRGMHYQLPPFAQTKLVRVTQGKVLDVVVDLRQGSPYFGQHVITELDAERKQQLFVPRGFAHGYVVLSKTAVFAYKCDNYYAPAYERGFRFDDTTLNLPWQLDEKDLILSEKDKHLPDFKTADKFDYTQNLYAE